MGNQPSTQLNNKPLPSYFGNNRSSPAKDKHHPSESEIIITENKFEQWKTDLENLIKRLHTGDKQKDYLKINCLLLPIKISYLKNSGICGDDDGKAIVKYEEVFSSLQQTVEFHLQKNMPFTASQLWNLLFTLVQDLVVLNSCPSGCFEFKYQNIYVDSLLKTIKIATPWSFLGHAENNQNIPQQDAGKMKIINEKQAADQKYDAYIIGMALAECILLQKLNLKAQTGQNDQKSSNSITTHDILVQKILKLSYYPLKLRMLIVGMIQLDFSRRFGCQNVYDLLLPHKKEINNFKEIHISKTSFLSKFNSELQYLDSIMHKIKRQSSQQLFKNNLGSFNFSPTKSNTKQFEPIPPKQIEISNSRNRSQLSGSSQSFNISATNPPITYVKHEDFESLNLSKQMKSSLLPQKQLVRKSLMNQPYSPDWKAEERKIQSEGQIEETEEIKNQFEEFAASEKSEEKEFQKKSKSHSSLNRSYKSSGKQNQDLQIDKLSKERNVENMWTPPPIQSSEAKAIQPSPIMKQQASKTQESHVPKQIRNSDQLLIYNDSPIEKRSQVVTEVVEYMSQIYQTQNFNLNLDQNLSLTSKDKQNILELKNEEFKVESDEDSSKNDTKGLLPTSSRDSMRDHEHLANFNHQDSIINQLDPLMASNKIQFDSEEKIFPKQAEPAKDKNSSLSEAAQKKLDYLNMFKKFSPEVIAQLNLATAYPDSQKLKRTMRQKISTHEIVMSKTRKLFPAADASTQPQE